MEDKLSTPVWRDPNGKGWEWSAVGEVMAMFIFAMVVLGACAGMVMQFVNPHRRARKIASVVQQAVDTAQQGQEDVYIG